MKDPLLEYKTFVKKNWEFSNQFYSVTQYDYLHFPKFLSFLLNTDFSL